MTTTLTNTRPALQPVIVQVNIDITALFWPLFAVAWLGWLGVAGIGRAVRGAWVDFSEWYREADRRLCWYVSRWQYGPMVGIG